MHESNKLGCKHSLKQIFEIMREQRYLLGPTKIISARKCWLEVFTIVRREKKPKLELDLKKWKFKGKARLIS